MNLERVIAFDLGAGSYRAIEGIYQNGSISFRELARYKHTPVFMEGHYYWDVDKIYENLVRLLYQLERDKVQIDAVGFDTWGADFGLLDENGRLLSPPVAYRDSYAEGMLNGYPIREKWYPSVGGGFEGTTTAGMLAGMKEKKFEPLARAKHLLMMPDLLYYMFTGKMINEYTIATTSRLLNAVTGEWDRGMIKELGISPGLFGEITQPGGRRDSLKEELVSSAPGLSGTKAVVVAGHDTAAAVSTMEERAGQAFISSGSWSVMGVVCGNPCLEEKACSYRLENEGQAGKKIRLLRNITGLWILEECMRDWNAGGIRVELTQLIQEAEKVERFQSVIYTDAPCFRGIGGMPGKIQDFCRKTGQKLPQKPSEFAAAIIQGLAFEYRKLKEELEEVTGNRITTISIVGGGAKNSWLSQCAADATNCEVICGYAEAAAAGNAMMQLYALGKIEKTADFYKVLNDFEKRKRYVPARYKEWDREYKRYLQIRIG